jgi:hypothetical protein
MFNDSSDQLLAVPVSILHPLIKYIALAVPLTSHTHLHAGLYDQFTMIGIACCLVNHISKFFSDMQMPAVMFDWFYMYFHLFSIFWHQVFFRAKSFLKMWKFIHIF